MADTGSFAEAAAALEGDFTDLDDARDKVEHLIELGRALPPLPEAAKTEANRVRGCQSQVWVTSAYDPETGRVRLAGDSDAILSKGLVALVLRLYGDRTPREILDHPPGPVFERLGLGRLITPGRSSGLYAMAERVRRIAEAFGSATSAPPPPAGGSSP